MLARYDAPVSCSAVFAGEASAIFVSRAVAATGSTTDPNEIQSGYVRVLTVAYLPGYVARRVKSGEGKGERRQAPGKGPQASQQSCCQTSVRTEEKGHLI